jgi:hypothetical protein
VLGLSSLFLTSLQLRSTNETSSHFPPSDSALPWWKHREYPIVRPISPTAFNIWAMKSFLSNRTCRRWHRKSRVLTTDRKQFNHAGIN